MSPRGARVTWTCGKKGCARVRLSHRPWHSTHRSSSLCIEGQDIRRSRDWNIVTCLVMRSLVTSRRCRDWSKLGLGQVFVSEKKRNLCHEWLVP